MKIEIENTDQIVTVSATEVPARVWVGRLPDGTEVQLLVTRVAISREAPAAAQELLARELAETSAPRPEPMVFPLRMIL